jgi:hypothetical protein
MEVIDKQELERNQARIRRFKADLKRAGYVAVLLPIAELPGIRYELSCVAAERIKSKKAIELILAQIREA